jgi:TPR repeat protein
MYLKGTGVAKNEQKAVLWLRKAAEQGLKEAQDVVNAITAERRRHDESVRLFSESACDRVVAVDLQAAAACRGDCNLIINNFNAFRACSGDCNDIQGNSNVRLACEGNCSALRDPAAGYACHSCGGGPAWASMYLLGFVMKCN